MKRPSFSSFSQQTVFFFLLTVNLFCEHDLEIGLPIAPLFCYWDQFYEHQLATPRIRDDSDKFALYIVAGALSLIAIERIWEEFAWVTRTAWGPKGVGFGRGLYYFSWLTIGLQGILTTILDIHGSSILNGHMGDCWSIGSFQGCCVSNSKPFQVSSRKVDRTPSAGLALRYRTFLIYQNMDQISCAKKITYFPMDGFKMKFNKSFWTTLSR